MHYFLVGEDYIQDYLEFIRNEKKRRNVTTMARIQPFCRANIINLGYFDGIGVFLDRLQIEIMLCFYTTIIFVQY